MAPSILKDPRGIRDVEMHVGLVDPLLIHKEDNVRPRLGKRQRLLVRVDSDRHGQAVEVEDDAEEEEVPEEHARQEGGT